MDGRGAYTIYQETFKISNRCHSYRPSPSTGGYFVPAGAVVAPSVTNLHMDTAVWGPDAREFRCVLDWKP